MYKTALSIIIVSMSLCCCKEAVISDFNETPGINFQNSASTKDELTFHHTTRFDDKDHVSNVTEKEDSITLSLMGPVLLEEKKFCLKSEEFHLDSAFMEVKFRNNGVYTFPAGVYTYTVKYRVKCPKVASKEHMAVMSLDFTNPENQFVAGRTEGLKIRILTNNDLRPRNWNESLLGEYSSGKYKFIMDEISFTTLDEMKLDIKLAKKIQEGYANYIKTQKPILDDKGEPITWPIL